MGSLASPPVLCSKVPRLRKVSPDWACLSPKRSPPVAPAGSSMEVRLGRRAPGTGFPGGPSGGRRADGPSGMPEAGRASTIDPKSHLPGSGGQAGSMGVQISPVATPQESEVPRGTCRAVQPRPKTSQEPFRGHVNRKRAVRPRGPFPMRTRRTPASCETGGGGGGTLPAAAIQIPGYVPRLAQVSQRSGRWGASWRPKRERVGFIYRGDG